MISKSIGNFTTSLRAREWSRCAGVCVFARFDSKAHAAHGFSQTRYDMPPTDIVSFWVGKNALGIGQLPYSRSQGGADVVLIVCARPSPFLLNLEGCDAGMAASMGC